MLRISVSSFGGCINTDGTNWKGVRRGTFVSTPAVILSEWAQCTVSQNAKPLEFVQRYIYISRVYISKETQLLSMEVQISWLEPTKVARYSVSHVFLKS